MARPAIVDVPVRTLVELAPNFKAYRAFRLLADSVQTGF